MHDIVVFIIGIISIIFTVWFERNIFRDKEDNFKGIISKKGLEGRLSRWIVHFGVVMPNFIMQQSALKGLYQIIMLGILTVLPTSIYLICYRKNKPKSRILKVCIVNITSIVFIIAILIIYWPKNIFQIRGKNIENVSFNNVRIIYSNSMSDVGTDIKSSNSKDIYKILDYLKTYKYIQVGEKSSKELDKKEYQIVVIESDNKELLRVVILGNGYIKIKNKYGFYRDYKALNNNWRISCE